MTDNKKFNSSRRSLLKSLGATGLAVAVPAGVAGASNGKAKGRQIDVDTGQYETLGNCTVEVTEAGDVHVNMGGTVSPGTSARGYEVSVEDLVTPSGKVKPEQARAVLQEVGRQELPEQANGKPEELKSAESGTTTGSGSEGLSTQGHDGADFEGDYEGGAWLRSKDPANLDVTKTDHWMSWTTSDGEVDYIDYYGEWWAGEFYVPPSDWDHNGSWFDSIDWSGTTVEHTYKVDYINWTWQYNHNKTEAFHRIGLRGYPWGDIDWWTDHWHTGEDANLLSAKAGHHSNCPSQC